MRIADTTGAEYRGQPRLPGLAFLLLETESDSGEHRYRNTDQERA
jgi:hypothetical protein